eukprot:6253288-Prymnesium_polylepis.2
MITREDGLASASGEDGAVSSPVCAGTRDEIAEAHSHSHNIRSRPAFVPASAADWRPPDGDCGFYWDVRGGGGNE